MWYEFATNRKIIDSMFPLGFELQKPELSSILISDNDVKLSLNCNEIPSSYPKEWMKEEFNAIRITIELGDVVNLKYSGDRLGWLENFIILGTGIDTDKSINIKTNTFKLECSYKYLTIRNIQAYHDICWT